MKKEIKVINGINYIENDIVMYDEEINGNKFWVDGVIDPIEHIFLPEEAILKKDAITTAKILAHEGEAEITEELAKLTQDQIQNLLIYLACKEIDHINFYNYSDWLDLKETIPEYRLTENLIAKIAKEIAIKIINKEKLQEENTLFISKDEYLSQALDSYKTYGFDEYPEYKILIDILDKEIFAPNKKYSDEEVNNFKEYLTQIESAMKAYVEEFYEQDKEKQSNELIEILFTRVAKYIILILKSKYQVRITKDSIKFLFESSEFKSLSPGFTDELYEELNKIDSEIIDEKNPMKYL